MQEVEAICSRALIINKGILVADDKVEILKGQIESQSTYQIEFASKINTSIMENLSSIEELRAITDVKFEIVSSKGKDPRSDIFEMAKKENWTILEIKTLENDLESIFHRLTQN